MWDHLSCFPSLSFLSTIFFFQPVIISLPPSIRLTVGLSGTLRAAKPSTSVKTYGAGTVALLCLGGGIHSNSHTHTHSCRSKCAQLQPFTLRNEYTLVYTHVHSHMNTHMQTQVKACRGTICHTLIYTYTQAGCG